MNARTPFQDRISAEIPENRHGPEEKGEGAFAAFHLRLMLVDSRAFRGFSIYGCVCQNVLQHRQFKEARPDLSVSAD